MLQKKKVKWFPLPRIEKVKELNNPYCGWYSLFRFYADSRVCHNLGVKLEDIVIASSQQLCLVVINLIAFNNRDLTIEALQNIRNIIQYFALQDKQIILRFVYDWEGSGILSEPKDIEYILKHMDQLSNILKENEKNICIHQGLFIGSWGEMHNSRYLTDRHMYRLAKQLYNCLGESTEIALRCPSYWRMIFKTYQPLNDETAYTKFMGARFSLFNDGMLASETDFGTYGSTYGKEATNHSEKWIRKNELEFQNKLCKYVSNGGEVINNCEYNDGGSAIEDLRVMRVSYLHTDYDKQVLDKWKISNSGISSSLWKDKSAFEYISAHLGYRFVINDVNMKSARNRGLKVIIKLINTGFAPSYHKFDVKLLIRNITYTDFEEFELDVDTRKWMPQDIIIIEKVISIDKKKSSKYILSFGIYDQRTQKSIEIANTFAAMDYMGYYNIGIIENK